jgi:uncharacterized protein YbcI
VQTPEPSGEALARISSDLVGLHHRFFGKGPNKAKTFYRDDTVICLLSGGRTTVEQTLIESGDVNAARDVRRSFQDAMESQFKAAVAKATGRNVIAYISQIHPDFDQAVEVFVL